MNLRQKLKIIEEQDRAFIIGTVEFINDQWVFFDAEEDEAALLEEMLENELEVRFHNKWISGKLTSEGRVIFQRGNYQLKNGDTVRVPKALAYSFRELLEELTDESFMKFASSLNILGFSLYDCIYCHNQLGFLGRLEHQKGVNFAIFDNLDQICSVQHHFERGSSTLDRFEMTLSDGTRQIVSLI